jgi:hypothetical protein
MSTACGASDAANGGAASSAQSPSPSVSVSATSSVSAATKATEAFVALAEDKGSATVPWSKQVAYYIGDVRVADLKPEQLPDALRSCSPGKKEYEGRTCPVSPLETVASMAKSGSDVVVDSDAPTTVGCTKVTNPKEAAGLTAASIRPPENKRDCFSDFAVTLFTDEAGDVATIQFTLSSP